MSDLDDLDREQYATRPPHVDHADPGPTWHFMRAQAELEARRMLFARDFDDPNQTELAFDNEATA